MERCAKASTQLDVDLAILDYLLYKATKSLLEAGRLTSKDDDDFVKRTSDSTSLLQLVEDFLAMFRSMHPEECGSTEISFRLRLLRFTSMFTSRLTPLIPIDPPVSELLRLRQRDKLRADAYHHGKHMREILTSDTVRQSDQQSVASKPGKRTPRGCYRASGKISLLDTLPDFMSLSAAQSVLQDRPITDVWMRLAAGYMAHAALEQSLVYDVSLSDALRVAFAWGFDVASIAEEGSDDWQVNAMFLGEDDQIAGWSEIKEEHLRTLIPPPGTPLLEHAEELLAAQLPLDTFELNLLMFIEGLVEAQPKPLYVQLENELTPVTTPSSFPPNTTTITIESAVD